MLDITKGRAVCCDGNETKEGTEVVLNSLEMAKDAPKFRFRLGKGGSMALYVNRGV
jgi:hypothetical protein